MFPEEPICLLSASVIEEDHTGLRRILRGTHWEVVGASTSKDAKALLQAHKAPLVICAAPLYDSGWRSWVAETCHLPEAPKLVMSSRLSGESLWAEALDLGCYDVLSWPYVASEVLRVASLAWHRWNWERRHPVVRPKQLSSAFQMPGASDANRASGVR